MDHGRPMDIHLLIEGMGKFCMPQEKDARWDLPIPMTNEVVVVGRMVEEVGPVSHLFIY
jgi:hypothetical protein